MTLSEAIAYCDDVIKECERHTYQHPEMLAYEEKFYDAKERAEKYRQIAAWLKILKRILDSGDCNNCAMLHSQCRYAPRWGEQVRYNCPFYSREKESQDGFTKWAKSVADSYRNDKEETE